MAFKEFRPSALLIALLSTIGHAQAHAAYPTFSLPTHHAALAVTKIAPKLAPKFAFGHTGAAYTSKSFASLLTKQNAGLFLPGAGSASVRAFNAQTNAIVQNASSYGIANVLETQIQNGTITGAAYFNIGGTSYGQLPGQTPITMVFGSNPLNTGGGPVAPTVFPTTNNVLSLQTIAYKTTGSGLIKLGAAGGPPPSHFSIAQQSFLSRDKALNVGAVSAASKVPITGGEFSGTFYDAFDGGVYTPSGQILFAFGNNPLNMPLAPGTFISVPNPTNYIDFGTLQKTITSGELFSTAYAPTIREGLLVAVGKDPLNTLTGGSFVPTNFTSFLHF